MKVEITNEEKILFPQDKMTKGDLIDYYTKIAPFILPYTKNRPISMVRFPNGIKREGFYQKQAGGYFPGWIKTKKIKHKENPQKFTNYVIVNNASTLIYLANQACIEIHTWLSKIDKLDYPDKIIFDLDPRGPGAVKDFSMVRKAALLLKKKIDKMRMTPFAMTTGSRGIHIIVPIKRTRTFDESRHFARTIAQELVEEHGDIFTLRSKQKEKRKRIFIDTLRNGFGQTAIIPYGVRAKKGVPVATPISWNEVKSSSLRPDKYNIKNIFKRINRVGNPWR